MEDKYEGLSDEEIFEDMQADDRLLPIYILA